MFNGMHDKEVCLGIAVDHRLQKIIQECHPKPKGRNSRHLELIKQLGTGVTRNGKHLKPDEVAVAVDLAGPPSSGGVCFLLQQPAQHHPYHLGSQAVIDSSPSLKAVRDVWELVSGSAEICSILDQLPFTPTNIDVTPSYLSDIQEWSMRILQAERADVIVCMGQRTCTFKNGVQVENDQFRLLQPIGIGRKFDERNILMGNGATAIRINASHPSFAMNYNMHMSCFRQLHFLTVAEARGHADGSWREEPWMDQLRHACVREARILAARQYGGAVR